jgi:hypothetical protein
MKISPRRNGRHQPHREDMGYSRTVSYDTRNHWYLITQRWGSINRKIFPFLLVNALLASAVLSLLIFFDIDLTISQSGHEFMSVLLAFLVINKLQFTLEVYVSCFVPRLGVALPSAQSVPFETQLLSIHLTLQIVLS